jgi:cell division protein FtsQ
MANLGASAMIIALLLAAMTAWQLLDRPIGEVRVKGRLNPAEQKQVRESLSSTIDGGLLSADIQATRSALQALSWPRHVNVRRVWPGRLEVTLDKALVVAGWGKDYLTIEGKVVQLAARQPDLVQFDCRHTAPGAALELYQRLQRDVSSANLKIQRLEENRLGEWSLTFSNGIGLNIGGSELDERVRRFVAVYQAELAGRVQQVVSVDARYANGVAVSWRDTDTQLPSTGTVASNDMRAIHGFR